MLGATNHLFTVLSTETTKPQCHAHSISHDEKVTQIFFLVMICQSNLGIGFVYRSLTFKRRPTLIHSCMTYDSVSPMYIHLWRSTCLVYGNLQVSGARLTKHLSWAKSIKNTATSAIEEISYLIADYT